MIRKLLFGSLLFLAVSGCQPDNVCEGFDACANAAPASEIQALENYLAQNSITATKHCSGVYYTITTPGTGKQAEICSTIGIHYTGRFTNGVSFDQSGPQGANFELSRLIAGWQNTIPMLKEGGKIKLYVPPSLGYGSQDYRDANGNVIIPGNSILLFDIELIAVR
jgi:FKBP-type peptidyl-prolyl cis-trans isomerase FkpA